MNLFLEKIKDLFPRPYERNEQRYFRFALYVLVAAIVLTLVLGLTSFLISLRGAEETMVPDVAGMQLPQALVELQERDLVARVQLRHFSDPSLKGSVVEQEPAAGTLVRENKRISLLVSRGAVVDRVGDYVGQTVQEVRTELQTVFSTFDPLLQVSDVSYVYSEEPAGTVLEQDPEAGTELSEQTELDLVVSRGPDVERIELRSYAGLNYEEAIELLADQNIPFVFELVEGSAEDRSGIVLSQSPDAGSDVAVGSKVTLEMIAPRSIPDRELFGLFSRTLPDYPVAVELTLEVVSPEGERRTIFSMEHPGGEIAVPYRAEQGSRLILSRFDTEVITEAVGSYQQSQDSSGGE
jgi:beta-lactam-binding protein with PASTA domain